MSYANPHAMRHPRCHSGLRLLLFAAVGGLAFAVDMGVLGLLVHGAGLAPAQARPAAILTATSAAWYVNRRLTFAGRGRAAAGLEWLRYLAVNALGMALNYGVYVAIVTVSAIGAAHPLASVIPGGVIALVLNYGLASRLVFSPGVLSSAR